MTVKKYTTSPKTPGLELHHQKQFTVMPKTLVAQSAMAAEYTDSISAEDYDYLN